MSSVAIACLTSDPGFTTLYGLTYKPTLSMIAGQITLFKSRPNPSSTNDMDWTIISTESILKGGFLTHKYTSMSCAINSAGVFTAIGYYSNNKTTTQGMMIDPTPGMASLEGVRFVPTKLQQPPSPEGNNSGVLGEWIPIDIEPNYNRTVAPDYKDQKLFYIKDNGVGVERLVHAYIDTNATIRIGRVDGAPLTPTLNYTTSFQNDTLVFGNATNIAGGDNELFVYSSGSRPSLSAITLTNNNNSNSTVVGAGTLPTIRKFPAIETAICQNATKILSTTWRSSYHLLCSKTPIAQGSNYGLLVSIENTLIVDSIRLIPIIDDYSMYPLLDNFVSIQSDNPTQPQPLAVLMTNDTFGTVNLGSTSPGIATTCAAALLALFFGLYMVRRVRRFWKQQLALKNECNSNLAAMDREGRAIASSSAPPLHLSEYPPLYESIQPTGLTTHQRPSVITTLRASTP
ncbi:hypothetical protein BG015_003279 [Linnemannia schmuckeri]|uniref:Uncharacterized protein n=1 Tax=Linnemannia schmuckeri TaxID=64567 RepID=A0A9P5S654_9FUNG|nr:hypothetical protein BG015_003279 [Linnemannia schmuckeri]